VSTPSQIDPDRWVTIGAAWKARTDNGNGIEYISVQLDVMPNTGRLSLFPFREKKGKGDGET
jgi:uncharacterized protein (DUF736 family)